MVCVNWFNKVCVNTLVHCVVLASQAVRYFTAATALYIVTDRRPRLIVDPGVFSRSKNCCHQCAAQQQVTPLFQSEMKTEDLSETLSADLSSEFSAFVTELLPEELAGWDKESDPLPGVIKRRELTSGWLRYSPSD